MNNTTLSINEIALMLNYSNSSNFHKDFKEYYQLSPREYVKNRLQV
ncbi:helix-turn-helix domain-containing protein [Desulfovibrio sp. 6_1_46AFAA]